MDEIVASAGGVPHKLQVPGVSTVLTATQPVRILFLPPSAAHLPPHSTFAPAHVLTPALYAPSPHPHPYPHASAGTAPPPEPTSGPPPSPQSAPSPSRHSARGRGASFLAAYSPHALHSGRPSLRCLRQKGVARVPQLLHTCGDCGEDARRVSRFEIGWGYL